MQYRLAIVEDNATARASLRSHLLPMGLFEVSSFASGTELKAALRKQHFELIIFDFHLGSGKNGVNWVQSLRDARFIKPSTGIIFLTSDRIPQTIGQIMDVQPDILLIKPYNIGTLRRQLDHYISYRSFVSQVLSALDDGDLEGALRQISRLTRERVPRRLQSDIVKLHARLLVDNQQYTLAQTLYENVLQQSDKVLWAQWGRVKCQYASGNYLDCTAHLDGLVETSLAREKAFEWLACLSFEQQAYEQAEQYLNHIKASELSMPATRLKTQTFQRQNRVLDSIELLQRKRAMHRTANDTFNDFTFALAEFYLQLAENSPETNRQESLSQARKLIGIAGRSQRDPQQSQKRDYLLAYSATLENDLTKAGQMIKNDGMSAFARTDTPTLIVAAKVHASLGNVPTAKALMQMAHERNQLNDDISDRLINSTDIITTEQQLGLASDTAFDLNDKGTELFVASEYLAAMDHFYQACLLLPSVPAFLLNLLQCMVEAGKPQYKRFAVHQMLADLQEESLSEPNQQRLNSVIQQINSRGSLFSPPSPA
ncbi:response regulator [Alteromonas sp. ASW11-19]|uniref:Response regulator n=1 Tax=Alteromonas salexigens TaxID=2982530 RepID=A0ABT2VLN2_9ALTE|nr:response regulator [Alteromonas salexigens]MCU7554226.1 response regulator [Alteromonas salexigens]